MSMLGFLYFGSWIENLFMVSDEQLMGNMNNTSRNSSYCCLCLKSKVRRRRGEKIEFGRLNSSRVL